MGNRLSIKLAVFAGAFLLSSAQRHPVYLSVAEIEYGKDQTLEVSVKLFTDDFEKTLRNAFKAKIDLLDPNQHNVMNGYVRTYIQRHLFIKAVERKLTLNYVGFENAEEGIVAYFETEKLSAPSSLAIEDDLLFEYKTQQINIIHATVNGERRSTKLVNPERSALLVWN